MSEKKSHSNQYGLTQLLLQWSSGDKTALNKLAPLVYDELRRLANYHLRRQQPGHSLQATALVNEAFLRLIDTENVRWKDRAHFFAVAAQAMRQILIDHARGRRRIKRGSGGKTVSLDEAAEICRDKSEELIALDDALTSLSTFDQRKSKIVELRFFGGLNIDETAEVLTVSTATVEREWRMAKAWLLRELNNSNDPEL